MTPARARAQSWGWTWDPGLEHAPGFLGAWTAPWHGGFLVFATGEDHPPWVTPEKASRGINRQVWTPDAVRLARASHRR